jgi:hypothetical protein
VERLVPLADDAHDRSPKRLQDQLTEIVETAILFTDELWVFSSMGPDPRLYSWQRRGRLFYPDGEMYVADRPGINVCGVGRVGPRSLPVRRYVLGTGA